jgi:deferrochelatase/peroxidase EfeB
MLELRDIQGLVFSGYARERYARYWFVRFGSAGAAAWLGRVLARVTTSERRERTVERRCNVAFSASGLRALGLSEAVLATFPSAFVRGIAAPERSRLLGDEGDSAPALWEFGGTEAGRVDALVLAYASSEAALDEESDALEDGFERFGFEAHVEDAYLAPDFRDHLGFVDARTNPRVSGSPRRRHKNRFDPSVAAGEFVLGYRNADGHFAASPRAPFRPSSRHLPPPVDARRALDLGRNGTFVVVRKLAQDVPGFWRFAEREGSALWPAAPDDPAEHFAEQLVGRGIDGRSLVNAPGREPGPPRDWRAENRFGYRELGSLPAACPVGAHVRRANPRDGLDDEPAESLATVRKHRLIRRGRLYGPRFDRAAPDARERGLLFMALCADLERQFEFVHEAWLNNPKFGGLTHERDPLVGAWASSQDVRGDTFSLQGTPFRRQVALERFVRVRGGAYLFMPGLRALSYLAEG